jgi:hypothetical protein
VIFPIGFGCDVNLVQVVDALGLTGTFPAFDERGHQHSSENANDSHHDQEFD